MYKVNWPFCHLIRALNTELEKGVRLPRSTNQPSLFNRPINFTVNWIWYFLSYCCCCCCCMIRWHHRNLKIIATITPLFVCDIKCPCNPLTFNNKTLKWHATTQYLVCIIISFICVVNCIWKSRKERKKSITKAIKPQRMSTTQGFAYSLEKIKYHTNYYFHLFNVIM